VAVSRTFKCPSCGAEIDAAARFCPSCGTVLIGTCPSCGEETKVGAQFCPSCGHRLDLAAPKEEERKLVTVLFADLTGSTALGEQLDPEKLRALLGDYFKAMASVIESWGGTVEKFIGDAVMSVFGIPAMHEDDPERALHAALDMQARLAEMNPDLAERHGVRLAMRIGVHTGDVIAGTGGDQFMVTGDVVNVAARLQQSAEPGEVVAGERTYLGTRRMFVFEPLEEKELRGKSRPVRAWRLIDQAEARGTHAVPGLATRLVGRDRELALLETLYRATVEGARPHLVTILGQAGIGKTRLTEEFLARAQSGSSPTAVYGGRCLPYGEGITYWALREILWAAAGILLDDQSALAGEKLQKLVRGVFEGSGVDAFEVDQVMYALATTAGISLPGNPFDQMSPESVGEELSLAWPRFLSVLAADRPVTVVIEDLHRAEPPLLDMMEHLVSRSTGQVLIIATGRPEFAEARPGWSSRPAMSQIGLEPLTDAQSRELLGGMLPDVGPELRERIRSAAEGNAFFSEEIVRHLIDEGVLERDGHEIVEMKPDPILTIPDTVRALLAARVDSLPAEEKAALQDAAVVGRIFWVTTLESMRGDAPIRAALRALENKGLVVTRPTSSLLGQTELSFNHGLTREVAYRSIPKGRRARAHAAVGGWVERVAGDRREEFVDLLAYHYGCAAEPEDAGLAWPDDASHREETRSRAVAALLDAGSAAKTRFAPDQAVGFAERALALANTEAERLAGLELKALAAHACVRADDAWFCYREALEIARQIGDVEAVSRLSANATLLWGRYGGAFTTDEWKDQAVDIVRRGLEEAGESAETFETGALLTGRSSFAYWALAPHEKEDARRDAERGIEIAEAINSPYLLSHALDALASLVVEEGFCGSSEIAERTLQLGQSMADRVEAHEMLVTAARAFCEAGRYEEAEEVADEAASQAARLSPHHRLHAAFAQANHLVPTGRLEKLLDATAPVLDLVVEEGSHTCGLGTLALAGHVLAQFETEDTSAAFRALELLDVASPKRRTVFPDSRTVEILRPIVGLDDSRRRLERIEDPENIVDRIYKLRAELQIGALAAEWHVLDGLTVEARALSRSACAPSLDWLADWGEAVHLATSGAPAEAMTRATGAMSSLDAYGERYTAARLMVDLLPLLERDVARAAAQDVADRLERMGALASAAEARQVASNG
jgi:class 3 adenylate cyclase/tetratricopeptide (TPR) repeat protein